MPRLRPEEKIIKKAERKLERLLRNSNTENTTDWEGEFVSDVKDRLAEFGSAFADPGKGDLNESLSRLQAYKVNQIAREMKLRDKIGMRAARQQVFGKSRKRYDNT